MEQIKSLLTVPYSEPNFKKFSINFLKEMDSVPLVEKEAPASFKNTIVSYTVFGTYKDAEGKDIVVLSVKVRNNSSARKAQRQFVSYLLSNEFISFNAALVAYYDDVRENWKLSFVTVDYELGESGVELKFKPAKRFSFLVGKDEPTKTYIRQLNPIYDSDEKPLLSSITSAFSVSRLSKDFYEEYRKKFFELHDYLRANMDFVSMAQKMGYVNSDGDDAVERFITTFCKKTMGQIVFLHFIQKKGWLGVTENWGDGDKQYLLTATKEFKGENFFDEVLEPLFYNALNRKRDDDLYLGKKVPFLNGGLFQPIEQYDWENAHFTIPNEYWFNKNEEGLLDVLAQYNFTVDESDPSEQEVAIDPEMLGKIFESLLDTNDRSALGAFYTPREIVHFMCEEALAARISSALNLDYNSILNFVRYGDALKETEFIETFALDIDEFVRDLTIVDPAVGSGAFLVGMLNEIVKLRTNLQQYTNACVDKYEMKMQAIQKSLYGVDLEYDAVEIAKLRLWLSLVVDQETNGNTPNPLPNLNFKLRVGNSLVDTYEGIKLWNVKWKGSKKKVSEEYQLNIFNVDTINSIMDRLKTAKERFFKASGEFEKQSLASQIERDQIELIRSEMVAQGKYDVFSKIEKMIAKKTKPFFIWELEFEEVFENGGFDIVIANPPYVQLQKDGGKLADELKNQGYETFSRMGDIYCIFYEKAFDLLKKQGILCYITSNKWMRAGYGEKLRGYLGAKSNPLKLIDFAGNKIFDSATVDVNVLIASNESNKGATMAVTVGDDCLENLSDYIIQHQSILSYDSSDNWVITSAIETSIKNKIETLGTKLQNWNLNINRGILTGYNDAFIIDETTKNILIDNDEKSAELIRPILRGKDIKKYVYDFNSLYLICTFPSKDINIENYPAIKDHLLSFDKRRLEQSGAKNIGGITGFNARKKTSNMWFETQDQISYWQDFDKQKIIYPCIMAKESSFMMDSNGNYYTIAPGNIISGENLYYLLGFLNSKIYYFALRKYYMGGGIEGELKTNRLLILPIPKPESIGQEDYTIIEQSARKIVSTFDEKGYLENDLLDLIDRTIAVCLKLSEEEMNYIWNFEF